MDWIGAGSRVMDCIKKYRYVFLVLLVGIFLMLLPEGADRKEETNLQSAETEAEMTLQEALENILSQIDGAGKVRVLLTQAAGEQTVYQMDEDLSSDDLSSDIRRETVIVSDTGLIQQINPPAYRGAIVICQGASSPSIRLAIVEAVANATGLTTDRITVLKMK